MGGYEWKEGFGLLKEWGWGGFVDWVEVLMEGVFCMLWWWCGSGIWIFCVLWFKCWSIFRIRWIFGCGGFKIGGGF